MVMWKSYSYPPPILLGLAFLIPIGFAILAFYLSAFGLLIPSAFMTIAIFLAWALQRATKYELLSTGYIKRTTPFSAIEYQIRETTKFSRGNHILLGESILFDSEVGFHIVNAKGTSTFISLLNNQIEKCKSST